MTLALSVSGQWHGRWAWGDGKGGGYISLLNPTIPPLNDDFVAVVSCLFCGATNCNKQHRGVQHVGLVIV